MVKKISIIIPIYNGSLLINRCLNSVFNQIGEFDLEVVVIDDGSTDNSIEIIKKYPGQIILLNQTNQGPAAARNKGIKKASGKYLAFLDADDYWEPTFLEEAVNFLEDNIKAIAVSVGQTHKIPGKPDTVAPKTIQTQPEKFNQPMLLDDFYNFWAAHDHVCTGSVLMRTEIVKITGGQRTELRITEDLEFWAYIATFGLWGFIPKVLFVSDGGVLTKQQGWLKKNNKRWASAPTIEIWEERIIKKIPETYLKSFNKAKGKIARNLTYAMILSNRNKLARKTVKKYGELFPVHKLSKIMVIASSNLFLWYLFSILINYRESYRKV